MKDFSFRTFYTKLKTKFVGEVVEDKKKNYIDFLQNDEVINMDEIPCYLYMNMDTKIDFQGNKNIEIINSGRNNYRISIILEVSGDGHKLPTLVIIKREEGKTIKKSEQYLLCKQKRNFC